MHIRTSIGGRRESLWECVITLTYVLWYEKAIVLKREGFFLPISGIRSYRGKYVINIRLVPRLYNMGAEQ